jgi:aspergillopepsin I
MRLSLSLVLFLSLSYDSLAAPTALRPRRSRSFRVERVKRSDYVAHGPSALNKAYRKFGIAPTSFSGVDLDDFEPYEVAKSAVSSNLDASDDDQTGEVAAKSVQSDVEFISTVTIGGQNISMDFDTGSADMYVRFDPPIPHSPQGRLKTDMFTQVGFQLGHGLLIHRRPHHLPPRQVIHLQSSGKQLV